MDTDMKLRSVRIMNFRSIRDQTFNVEAVDGSYTFALIGANETGKSTFLEAISLAGKFDAELSQKDYANIGQEVRITLAFELEKQDSKELLKIATSVHEGVEEYLDTAQVYINAIFDPVGRGGISRQKFVVDTFLEAGLSDTEAKELDKAITLYFRQRLLKITLWKPEKGHIINEPVQLQEFANNPAKFMPLYNCFMMAGLHPNGLIGLDEADESDFAEELGRVATGYINKIWRSYPAIRIKFHIGGGKLTLLIEDTGVRSKSKTMEQRSDGFRWFVSFLLTIAPNYSGDSPNESILLLDEPDMHLHPQAQADLLRELIRITQEDGGRKILFFATHSSHMIDKKNVDRCHKFSKQNGFTKVERANSGVLKSYAEVNYSVFEVAGNDYHDELYGYLASTKEGWDKLEGLPTYSKPWHNERTGNLENVSLSKYIRHSIHHPENKANEPFTDEERHKSIETMQRLVQELKGGTGANRGNNPSQKK